MSVLFGAPRTAPRKGEVVVDYSNMTKEQLRGLAEERGIAVPKSANKAQLIELLRG